MPQVFFSRCKPQYADAVDIALDNRIVFIGYPLQRAGAQYDPRNLKSCVADPSGSDAEWSVAHAASNKLQYYNQNRNLVRLIQDRSIVMIPRPARGLIYCGIIQGTFELVDSPPWYDDYMALRTRQGCHGDSDHAWHAADVGQCWRVDQFRPIPVPRIPAWIRRSMFGRTTYGTINAFAGIEPYALMLDLIERQDFPIRSWTTDVEEIDIRLITDLVPSTFEHLIVSLLQLERPDEVWTQVGGSGDGGVDGIGANSLGIVTGILQCKWRYAGEPLSFTNVWNAFDAPRKILASLIHPVSVSTADYEFLGRREIASLVLKHAHRLPQAVSMRIGREPHAP